MIELVDVGDTHTVVTLSGRATEVHAAVDALFERFSPYAYETRQILCRYFKRRDGLWLMTQIRRRNFYLPRYRRDYE